MSVVRGIWNRFPSVCAVIAMLIGAFAYIGWLVAVARFWEWALGENTTLLPFMSGVGVPLLLAALIVDLRRKP